MLLHKLGFTKIARGELTSQTTSPKQPGPISNFFKGVGKGVGNVAQGVGNVAQSAYEGADYLYKTPEVQKAVKLHNMVKSRSVPLYNKNQTNIALTVPKNTNKGTWQLNMSKTF